jgi:hypothetical protein
VQKKIKKGNATDARIGAGTKLLITKFLITNFLTHKVPNNKIPNHKIPNAQSF